MVACAPALTPGPLSLSSLCFFWSLVALLKAAVLSRELRDFSESLSRALLPSQLCFILRGFTPSLSPSWGRFSPSGEDPLAGDQNDHDMDSIAGVLKLYFRGLEHPLFPKDIFHDLMACVSKYPDHKLTSGPEHLVATGKFPGLQ